jgi:hypothetical protein
MRKAVIVTLVATIGAGPTGAGAQEKVTLKQVLVRAGDYVREFQRQLSSTVSEETYFQEVVPIVAPDANANVRYERRQLRSNLLLLRPENSITWVQFRDVLEVDGNPVPDRDDRLAGLLVDPTALTSERVNRLRSESARYNIGDIERTLNVPVLPLVILSPRVQSQFRFRVDSPGQERARDRSAAPLPETPNFRVSAEVWVVRFEERTRPTLVRTPEGASILSKGRFWIEPQSGRVLMSEMIAENDDVRAQVNVSYQSEPLVGLLVPVEMREQYRARRYNATISGQASYSRFRRAEADVRRSLSPIR